MIQVIHGKNETRLNQSLQIPIRVTKIPVYKCSLPFKMHTSIFTEFAGAERKAYIEEEED